MSNLVTTFNINIRSDIVSVNGSKAQNDKRIERLEAAIQELVDTFEGGIAGFARVEGSIETEERGDFGY